MEGRAWRLLPTHPKQSSVVQALAADVVTVPEPAVELIAEHSAIPGDDRLDQMPQVFVERLLDRSI